MFEDSKQKIPQKNINLSPGLSRTIFCSKLYDTDHENNQIKNIFELLDFMTAFTDTRWCVSNHNLDGWGVRNPISAIFSECQLWKFTLRIQKYGGGEFYRDMLTVNNFSKTTYSKQVKKQKLTWSKLDASTMWKMVWEYQSAVGYIQMWANPR